MKVLSTFISATLGLVTHLVVARNEDMFNYGATSKDNYGPTDWSKVRCNKHDTCPGWPDDWEKFNPFIPYDGAKNMCKDCSRSKDKNCLLHKQSPIHLFRNITSKRECEDRHSMLHLTGSCAFQDMSFSIERHSLRAYQPMLADGTIDCAIPSSIDFSMGFPNPWNLVFTDVKVPSEHTQDGTRYDAEIQLSHIYSDNIVDRLIGTVSIFLEADEKAHDYDFLELYIRRWKLQEQLTKDKCSRRNLFETQTKDKLRGNSALDNNVEDESMITRSLEKREFQFRRNFHAYDWIKKVGTQYYFRYEGSQGVPPCLEVVHWRVMKDSIRVSSKQIHQLESLIANRIDPVTCLPDTAGRPRANKSTMIDVTRPVQTTTSAHKVVYCECLDWESKRPNDQVYCNLTMTERKVLPYWRTLVNTTTLTNTTKV